jgi:hypothetical protein
MSENLERCLRLANEKSLSGITVGDVHGHATMLVNGEPTLVDHDGKLIRMKCTFEGCQVLLQTDPEAYFQPEDGETADEVLADISKISDEELSIHIMQAWQLHATQEQLKERPDG